MLFRSRVFPDSASSVSVNIYPENPLLPLTLEILNDQCQLIDTLSATGNLSFNHLADYAGWHTLRVRNTSNSQQGQKCWVKVNYTAPQVVNTSVSKQKCACSQTGANLEIIEPAQVMFYPNPFTEVITIEALEESAEILIIRLFDLEGKLVKAYQGNELESQTLYLGHLQKGIYFMEIETNRSIIKEKLVKQ